MSRDLYTNGEIVSADTAVDGILAAAAQTRCTLALFARTQELGAIVADTTVTLDPKRATASVADTCPPQLRGQADTKAARLLQFALEHRRNRRRAHRQPDTAYARWRRNRDRADPPQIP